VGWLGSWPGALLVLVALVGLAAGLTAGVRSGPLWLDEALSVEIARLPLSELTGALRQDGAPPLYYLLLHGWIASFGTGTVAVRLLSVMLVPAALWLAYLLGRRLSGVSAGRAAVIVLAALPWTMRFFSETRMYALVVVLVLAGALVLERVRAGGSARWIVALAAMTGALLLTHYWSLFLLAAVGLWHLPGALRSSGPMRRVVVGLVAGGVLFLPWLPTFVFQALHTGAPWARSPGVAELLETPRLWGGGSDVSRALLVGVLLPLVVLSAMRLRAGRALGLVALVTLLLAWTQTTVLGGAYTGRYTAVVVPLVCVAAGLGAAALPGRRLPLLALGVFVAVALAQGVPAAGVERTSADRIATAVQDAAGPDAVLAYCPDQLGPPVQRLLPPGYEQVVYPSLDGAQRIDWVDYAERQAAADPREVAGRLASLAAGRELLVLKAAGYRTFGLQCEALLAELVTLRGPAEHLFGNERTTGQVLYHYPAR